MIGVTIDDLWLMIWVMIDGFWLMIRDGPLIVDDFWFMIMIDDRWSMIDEWRRWWLMNDDNDCCWLRIKDWLEVIDGWWFIVDGPLMSIDGWWFFWLMMIIVDDDNDDIGASECIKITIRCMNMLIWSDYRWNGIRSLLPFLEARLVIYIILSNATLWHYIPCR